MTEIIRIPVFAIGTNSQSSELTILNDKKELQISLNCYLQNHLFLCDKKNLCISLQYHEILIIVVNFEEIMEDDENISDIFNLIKFMQVQKVLCLIVNHDHIKKPQWKISILEQYIENSKKTFKGITQIEPEYRIILFKKEDQIIDYLTFFQSSPKSVNWSENQETQLQIISQNGKELDVILLKGLLLSLNKMYLDNQNVLDARILVTKVEDSLNFIQQNQGRQIRKITVNDEQLVQGKFFMMNKTFQVKQITQYLEIKPFLEKEEKYMDFLTNYKMDQKDYIVLLNKCYDVQKLEFAPMKFHDPYSSIFRVSLNTQNQFIANKFENIQPRQIHSTLIIMNKNTEQIVAFCQINESNYTMSITPNQELKDPEKEMETLYIPLKQEDVMVKVQRGELVQQGKHITKCRLCMESEANCLLLPCSHIRYCFDCASEQQECLFCEQKISSKRKLKIRLLSPSKDQYLSNIPQSFSKLWRHSLQTCTDVVKAKDIESMRSTLDFQDYFCFNCQKQKSIFYRICEASHLIGYCDECIQYPQKQCLNECIKKIIFQGKFKYIFEE